MYPFLAIAGGVIVCALLVLFAASCRHAPDPGFGPGKTALDFSMKRIDGQEVDLRQYLGKVVLMVNVASKCGFTPQYEQLNAVYKKYRDQGFVVLGFPANNFLRQEPGSNADIQTFCKRNYGVEFDIFSKISVKGKDMAPLYVFLTSPKYDPAFYGSIKWNFTKFLLNREGKVIARFGPATKPDAPEVLRAIEQALRG
jgi:glutathione peroxidase